MKEEEKPTFSLDGDEIPLEAGQSILSAALQAGVYIPHLCYHPEFKPHGSCKLCVVQQDGRTVASCTTPARPGSAVQSKTAELDELRQNLVQFLFTEGNHFCPSCEASGNCKLQAVGYHLEVVSGHYNPLFPARPLDASHPDVLLELNRCILCELCVRASADVDHKSVFAISGRGITKHLTVSAESGRLADTDLVLSDKAVSVCPVGAILPKRRGFRVPIGQRTYDQHPISEVAVAEARDKRRQE